MLNKVKHLAFGGEILRCAQNDNVHHLTCDKVVVFYESERIHFRCKL